MIRINIMTDYEIELAKAKAEISECEQAVKLAEQQHTNAVARYLKLLDNRPQNPPQNPVKVYNGSFLPYSPTNYVMTGIIAKRVMNLASSDFGLNLDIRFLRAYFTWSQLSDMYDTMKQGVKIKLVDNHPNRVLTTPENPIVFKRDRRVVTFLESVDNEGIAQAIRELIQKRYGNPYSVRYLQTNFTKTQLLDMVNELLNGRLFNVIITDSE